MEPVFLVFADHHEGGGWAHRDIRGDTAFALEQIVSYAERHSDTLDAVGLLGDASDRQRNRSGGIVPLKNALRRIPDAGVTFGFLQGNHDADDPPWLSDPLFQHWDRTAVDVHGYLFYGLDYRPREEVQYALANDVPTDVTGLLMHQCWGDFMGDLACPQCELADVPSPVIRVVSGDNHTGFIDAVRRGKHGQEVRFVNPGATNMQEIAEPGDKYFAVMDAAGKFHRVLLKSRPVVRTELIDSEEAMDRFLETVRGTLADRVEWAASAGVPPEVQKPLLQVYHSHAMADVKRRVVNVVKDAAHLFWKETKPEAVTAKYHVNLAKAGGAAFTPARVLDEEFAGDDAVTRRALVLARGLAEPMERAAVETAVERWRAEQLGG